MLAALAILFLSLPSPITVKYHGQKSFECPCGYDEMYKYEGQKYYGERELKNDPRRITGNEIQITNPWYVFLHLKPRLILPTFTTYRVYRCGATLLNREWVVTTAHCVCNERIGFKCGPGRAGQIETRYSLDQIEMLLGISKPTPHDLALSRGAKTVVVHEGYKSELFDKSDNNIALIKFDRPFFWESLKKSENSWIRMTKMMPICLPHSNKFKDEDRQGFAAGWSEKQYFCRTNGIGPEIHKECAKTTIYTYKEDAAPKTHTLGKKQCITQKSPSRDHGTPCYYFHKNRDLVKHFQPDTADEIVLVPEGKGIKDATGCMRSEEPRYSQSGKHGWCGTIPPNGDVNTVAKPTVDSGWGYCTDDCRGGLYRGRKLQIENLDLLRTSDCQLLRNRSTPGFDKNMQLCAGIKIKKKPTPLFFTYSGEYRKMVFKKLAEPLKGWKPANMSTVPGLDFMIRYPCKEEGDSGGPLWVREKEVASRGAWQARPLYIQKLLKEKGERRIPIAYLVGISVASGAGSCARINNSGLFVRVKNYLGWIKKHAASGTCAKKVRAKKTKKTTKKKKKTRRKKKRKKKKKKSKKSQKKKGRTTRTTRRKRKSRRKKPQSF